MKALTALLISDGRPGHYHLAEGIIAAARKIRPIEVVRLEVRRHWSPHLLGALWNLGVPPASLLRIAYGLRPDDLPRADFIVSAGAETLTANVTAARLLNVPNIVYGSLRWFRPESFSLVLTSYAPDIRHPHHVMVLKPSSIEVKRSATAAHPVGPDRPPALAALLVGGNTTGFRYGPADWERLLTFAETTHRTLGTRWLATNSRRTPSYANEALAAYASRPDGPIARFVDVRTAGPGTLGPLFETAQAVVCTDDSSTMVSESISAGLPILGVRPQASAFRPQEGGYRRFLADNGWYRWVDLTDLTPERFLAEVGQIEPLKVNPLDELAGLLNEQLRPLFQPGG